MSFSACSRIRPFLASLLILVATIASGGSNAWAVTYFSQNFNSSSTVGDYDDAAPNDGQFNTISTSGGGVTLSITSGALTYARSGANAGSFSRTTNLTGSPATSLHYTFDLTISGNSVIQTNAARFQVGTNFGTANGDEANADTYARLGINWTATAGQFSLRNIDASASSPNFTGTQTITWVMNNSGAAIMYTAPDLSTESVANDVADVWIGTTRVFNEAPPTFP